jgi:lipopolysaccharide export system permease protein
MSGIQSLTIYSMKKLVYKKFTLDTFKFFLTSLFIIGSIVWVIQAINFFDYVTEDGHGLKVYVIFTFLNFPKIIHRILPFILLLSIFFTIISYEFKNELNIFWINGISKIEFTNKLLKFSIFIMLFQIVLGSIISPSFQFKSRNFLKNSNIDFFSSLIKEKKFINIAKNFTLFIEKQNTDGSYSNIFVDDSTKKISRTIMAKNGIMINSEKEKIFKLFEGKIINDDGININIFNFDVVDLNLKDLTSKTITVHKIQEIDTLSLAGCFIKIKKFNKSFECNKELNNEMKQELLKRLYKPIYIPVITIICCLLLISSKSIPNYKRYINFIFLISFLILVISEASLRYSSSSNISMMVYLFMPLIFFLLAYMTLYKKIENA